MNSIKNILKSDKYFLFFGSIFIGLLSSILIFGKDFYQLTTSVPGIYYGDGVAFLINLQRAYEGAWVFTNDRMGFPWISDFTETPQSDLLNYLIIKIFTHLTGSLIFSINIYFILGFIVIFITNYLLLRALKISSLSAFIGSICYALIAYHFLRLSHMFFTWYFVGPAYIYIYYKIINFDLSNKIFIKANLKYFVYLFLLPFFGGYYTLFSLFGFVFCFLIIYIKSRKFLKSLLLLATCLTTIVVSLVVNILPTIYYIYKNGYNYENLNRLPMESELYSFKISQLFIPAGYHILEKFRELSEFFYLQSAYANENATASLGILICVGLIISISNLLSNVLNREKINSVLLADTRILIAGLFILFFTLFASMGGLVSLYSLLISSTARGWNRVSIYIACFAIISLTILFDQIFYKIKNKVFHYLIVFAAVIFIILDQSPIFSQFIVPQGAQYQQDKNFYSQIEKKLPPNSAVFQFPYQNYPGDVQKYSMDVYAQSLAFLHTTQLHWSFGGMRWREGDWFYRHLALLPLNEQLDIIRLMGFKGITINKLAYCDGGLWITQQTQNYLNQMAKGETFTKLNHTDGSTIFLGITEVFDPTLVARVQQHLAKINYFLDSNNIPRPIQESKIKIDFKNTATLTVVKKITGLFDNHKPITYTNSIGTDFINPQANELYNFQALCEYKTARHLALNNKKLESSHVRFKKDVVLVFNHNLPKKFQFVMNTSNINHQNEFDVLIKYGNNKKLITLQDLQSGSPLEFENQHDLPIFTLTVTPKNQSLRDFFKAPKPIIPFELESIEILKIE